MNRRLTTIPTMTAALAVAGLVLAACGDSEDDAADTTDETAAEETAEATDDETEADMTAEDMDGDMAAGEPLGAGCAALADALPALAEEPVATAAGSVEDLSTLVDAVSGTLNPDADLVETLNSAEYTLFAPVNEAFEALDADTLDTLSTDADLLTTILTYHVVPEQLTPEEVAGTSLTTVEGTDVVVEGEPDALTVNGAEVICGGIPTANAQVYLIDTVLDPTTAPAADEMAEPTEEPTA